ncbi:TolC family outer membrane protein [Xenophilus arseniciresistens]|uniref:TolC family outer membrane protein n=1 Tax=Xenophilus arseniciresistens TaxID=1283306 RepID=A0AAE3N377_9BURK|nr:TolC family outer membrane protein [Xenophilus arseniciresistens]MDA7414975.1 TolC family outer membrane protein [Xenophilus arseniciresistens]
MPTFLHARGWASCALATAIGLAALPSAQAQNLVQLYEAARAHDATFQAARAQAAANTARGAQARAAVLPQVGLAAGVSRTEADIRTDAGKGPRDFSTQQVGIQATQPIYRPANWATRSQGERQAEIAQAQLQGAEQDLIVRLAQAYFDVLGARDTLALVQAQKAAVAEQLAAARRNFELGNATITDTHEAQALHDLVVAQEIAAGNELQVRQLALDELTGRSTAPWPLAQPVALPALTPAELQPWLTQAEAFHPALRQAQLAREVAALEVDKAKAGHLPTLDATLGYQVVNNPQGVIDSTVRTRVHAAQAGLQLNVPLFAGFATENRIKETLALEEQAQATLDDTRRRITQSTRAAWLGLQAGAGQVRALEAAQASSQSALDANKLGYQVGVRINIDVLNAQSQLFQTRRDLAMARYNLLLGQLKLRQANGSLTADDLRGINAVLGSAPASPAAPG